MKIPSRTDILFGVIADTARKIRRKVLAFFDLIDD
jgi:hypothetical protein